MKIMNFLELVKARKSERDYTSQEVEQSKLDYILECARLAPSAVNFQPWHFLIVKSEEAKEKVRKCYNREWIKTAPMYIVVCGDTSQSWKRKSDGKDHCDIDVAITTEHICLAAAEQGLGTCWVCNFDVELCRKEFGLPSNLYPAVIIPIGYTTDKETKTTSRKEPDDIIETV